jgi:hypothetical protein
LGRAEVGTTKEKGRSARLHAAHQSAARPSAGEAAQGKALRAASIMWELKLRPPKRREARA